MRQGFSWQGSLSGKGLKMADFRGKSLKAVIQDISEGYVTVNFLFLKPYNAEVLQDIYREINKIMGVIRNEKFPHNDIQAIRLRNIKLQRLHTALAIIRNYAHDKRIPLI